MIIFKHLKQASTTVSFEDVESKHFLEIYIADSSSTAWDLIDQKTVACVGVVNHLNEDLIAFLIGWNFLDAKRDFFGYLAQ